jgi:hypothetical protein
MLAMRDQEHNFPRQEPFEHTMIFTSLQIIPGPILNGKLEL